MVDPEDLDCCSLEDANKVLEILGIELRGCYAGPGLAVYNVVSSSGKHEMLGMRWSEKTGFLPFTFSSPGRFLHEILRDGGICEFCIWDGAAFSNRTFKNRWRGKMWEFMVECGLRGLA